MIYDDGNLGAGHKGFVTACDLARVSAAALINSPRVDHHPQGLSKSAYLAADLHQCKITPIFAQQSTCVVHLYGTYSTLPKEDETHGWHPWVLAQIEVLHA